MNLKYFTSVIVMTLMVVFGSSNIIAKHHWNNSHHSYVFSISYLEDHLNLSEKQKSQIEPLLKSAQMNEIKFKKQYSPINLEIKKELLKDTKNYNKLKSLLNKGSTLSIDMKLSMIKLNDEISAFLEPKQKRLFQDLITKKKHKYKKKKRGWFKRKN